MDERKCAYCKHYVMKDSGATVRNGNLYCGGFCLLSHLHPHEKKKE